MLERLFLWLFWVCMFVCILLVFCKHCQAGGSSVPYLCCEERLVPGMGALITLIKAEEVGRVPKPTERAASLHSPIPARERSGDRANHQTEPH